MAGLFPFYVLREWDNSGRILSGGRLHFYESGTLVPKATYTDHTLTIPHTNPVVLDSGGAADIWLGEGAYRVLLTDANGVQIRSPIDGIVGVGAGTIDASSNATMAVLKVYNDLRALTSIPDVVYLTGREEEGDGGAGLFQFQPGSTDTDDDGVILVTTTGSSVYKRIFDGVIDPLWYGVAYGPSVDQALAFQAACAGSVRHDSPVDFKGVVFLGQNVAVPALAHLEFSAGAYLVAGAPVSVTFADNSGLDGDGVIFGTNVSPSIGQGVCDAIRLSWMGGDDDTVRWSKVLTCSTEKYGVLMDVSTTIDSDLTVPANFSVKPVGGAILTVDGPSDLDMNLDHSAPIQCFAFTQAAYIQSITLSTPVVYMEWFGGSSVNTGTANATPFKACCAAKRLDLQAGPLNYSETSVTPFTISDFVTWVGNGSKITLNQAVTFLGIYLNDITVFGSGSITHSSCVATKTTSIVPLLVGPTSATDSNLISVAWVTKAQNSQITNPGSIEGQIASCSISSSASIQIKAALWADGCTIQSTSVAPVFVFADGVTESAFVGCIVEAASTFMYSANALLVVTIQGCQNPDWSNGQAIHNGIATVNVIASGVRGNSAVTTVDGITQRLFSESIPARKMGMRIDIPSQVVTASLTGWKGLNVGTLSTDGLAIVIGTESTLGSTPWSLNTLRFIGSGSGPVSTMGIMEQVWRYGGQMAVKIEYPAGVAPDPAVKICVAYVCPSIPVGLGMTAHHFFGKSTSVNLPAINAAKTKNFVNIWGGQSTLSAPGIGGPFACVDEWGDVTYSVAAGAAIPGIPRIVIYNEGSGSIPVGTKITLDLGSYAPTAEQYRAYWPETPFETVAGVAFQSGGGGGIGGPGLWKTPYVFRTSDANGIQIAKVRPDYGSGVLEPTPINLPVTVWANGTTLNGSYS